MEVLCLVHISHSLDLYVNAQLTFEREDSKLLVKRPTDRDFLKSCTRFLLSRFLEQARKHLSSLRYPRGGRQTVGVALF